MTFNHQKHRKFTIAPSLKEKELGYGVEGLDFYHLLAQPLSKILTTFVCAVCYWKLNPGALSH